MIGLRSRRGATSVTNSAMPMLTGTAITQGDEPDEERAVDHRPGAELALRRVPVVGEDPEALLRGTTATRSSWSCTRSAPRITRTSSPLASAIHRNTWSVMIPGGRGPVPRPRGAGAGGSVGRGGAVTAMWRSGIYANWRSSSGGTGRAGGTRPVRNPPEITTTRGR